MERFVNTLLVIAAMVFPMYGCTKLSPEEAVARQVEYLSQPVGYDNTGGPWPVVQVEPVPDTDLNRVLIRAGREVFVAITSRADFYAPGELVEVVTIYYHLKYGLTKEVAVIKKR